MRLVSRGDTTVVDAYLSPVLRRYVDEVAAELAGVRVLFMQSNGGLTEAASFRGKDSILSGPAGGIVGMARTAGAAGFDRVIGFDMGGTSTDVSHFAGEFERQYETQVAGVRLRAPMLSIHTVAAGGGSVLHFDDGRYQVGPDSAGAAPGPACYGHGGPLTVTDANVLLGRVQPAHFPKVFGPAGDQPLDADAARAKFARLAGQITTASGDSRGPAEVAAGFLEIAVQNMANAIKKISVQRGYDVTRYVLSTFGGAGGQHACAVAAALGMTSVLIHPLAGALSAYGIGLADVIAMRETAVEAPLDPGPGGEPQGRGLQATGGVGPRRTRRQRRIRRWRRGDPPGPPTLRGHGHPAPGPLRPGQRDDRVLRAGLPDPLLLPHAGQAHRGRGGLGGGGRRRQYRGHSRPGRAAGKCHWCCYSDTGGTFMHPGGRGWCPPRRPSGCGCSPRGSGRRSRCTGATACCPVTPWTVPRSSPRTWPRPWSSPAGAPR